MKGKKSPNPPNKVNNSGQPTRRLVSLAVNHVLCWHPSLFLALFALFRLFFSLFLGSFNMWLLFYYTIPFSTVARPVSTPFPEEEKSILFTFLLYIIKLLTLSLIITPPPRLLSPPTPRSFAHPPHLSSSQLHFLVFHLLTHFSPETMYYTRFRRPWQLHLHLFLFFFPLAIFASFLFSRVL